MKPFGILSDSHAHSWSAFSHVSEEGINNRLTYILDEFERCAAMVVEAGGNTIYHAGDIFHVRGSVAPSVFNPTKRRMEEISRKYGITWHMLPGNHDMEAKESSRVGNATEMLASDCIHVIHESSLLKDNVLMIPWMEKVADLKADLEKWVSEFKGDGIPHNDVDLIIHAPVNGVIWGIPDHGLDAPYLASLGFRRVFAGHYHHHVQFEGGVYSIGATCHHTWSDVGTKAGFLIVSDDDVSFFKAHAPEFVEISGDTDADEIPLLVDGNYVRCKVDMAKSSEIETLRYELMGYGARGVVIHAVKKPVTERSATTPTGVTIQASIADYIKGQKLENPAALQSLCERILNDAEAV